MPPTLAKAPTPPVAQTSTKKIQFAQIQQIIRGQRVVIYGPGGIGKTELCCLAPGEVACVDADESLQILKSSLDRQNIPLPSLLPVHNWRSLREALQCDGWGNKKTVFLDSITKIEEWCSEFVIETVPHEKGNKVQIKSIEDYGWGKGYQHVFETFLTLLGDLDALCRKGINVILVAHDCTNNVPNPSGDDWIRYEPRLQNPNSGKNSIRLRVKEWADHVLFLGYDVEVIEGVGKGSSTRTLHTYELPHCMAKSRTVQEMILIEQGISPWEKILK